MNVLLLLMGGSGERFGGSIPKQFVTMPFEGKELPLYAVTAIKLLRALPIDACILVVSRQFSKQVKNSIGEIQREFPDRKFSVTAAGITRFVSFLNGVRAAEKLPSLERIAVHDANRPYLNPDFLQRVSQTMGLLSADTPVFIPAIPVVDSVVRHDHRRAVCYERRDELAFVQTPQLIHYPTFRAAHENA
ncbi:MAG: 2-C-methyl-D-erythritol 4-phosphate cytidylyltransferase, partial [Turneriella sp.]|nr:2-C-methyl-D-erythritol 4-phosphate cytidylyltransferase [Turneriella sp.]